MKKHYYTITVFLLVNLLKAQLLTLNDFNYLNQGYWNLESNGYKPRQDLTLHQSYSQKNTSSNWYFMTHKICKDTNYIGYMLTGKPFWESKQQYNLFFLNEFDENASNHNTKVISTSPVGGYDGKSALFLFRSTTTYLYDLENNPCKPASINKLNNTPSKNMGFPTGKFIDSSPNYSSYLTIPNSDATGFQFDIEISTIQMCTGEIKGTAKYSNLLKTEASFKNSNGCTLKFRLLNEGIIEIIEEDFCIYDHGQRCVFSGKYKK